MAVNYATSLKQTRMQAVIDAVDAGTGPGTLEIGTTGMASVLATLTLPDPSGTASGATLTWDFDPDISDTDADNTGTAAEARFKDSDGTVVVSGLTVTLTGNGGDVTLDSLSITAGQTVTITSGSFTHG